MGAFNTVPSGLIRRLAAQMSSRIGSLNKPISLYSQGIAILLGR